MQRFTQGFISQISSQHCIISTRNVSLRNSFIWIFIHTLSLSFYWDTTKVLDKYFYYLYIIIFKYCLPLTITKLLKRIQFSRQVYHFSIIKQHVFLLYTSYTSSDNQLYCSPCIMYSFPCSFKTDIMLINSEAIICIL